MEVRRVLFRSGSSGRSKLRTYNLITGNGGNGVEELGDLGFVGIADDKADAWEGRDFFGWALGVTTGYEDARCRIGSVNFTDGGGGLSGSGRVCSACIGSQVVGQ